MPAAAASAADEIVKEMTSAFVYGPGEFPGTTKLVCVALLNVVSNVPVVICVPE